MKGEIVWLAFVSILFLSTALVTSASPRTWTVDDDGPADFQANPGG